jgi:hypothetical protein
MLRATAASLTNTALFEVLITKYYSPPAYNLVDNEEKLSPKLGDPRLLC